jgi:hypothetical protein
VKDSTALNLRALSLIITVIAGLAVWLHFLVQHFHIALDEINNKLLSLDQPPLTPIEQQFLAADF